MSKSFLQLLREFSKAEGGAIAPLFGLLAMALLIMLGVSIDTARGTRVAKIASDALDATALAAARALRLENPTDAELTQLVQDFFATNFAENAAAGQLQNIVVTPDRVINSVKLVANLKVPATMSAIMGRNYLEVKVDSTAVFDVKDVEVSMMLDVSGSMAGSKIADLKSAAQDLVDIMLPEDKPHNNKVAIAPFATAVNAGDLAEAVSVGTDNRGRSHAGRWTTCVTERNGTHRFRDTSPSVRKLHRRSATCPTAVVQPLTNDLDVLEDAIEDLQADGYTAGHLGIAWAYYLLSPNWASVFPAESAPVAYTEEKVRKVAILMTDGMFNNYYENGNGDSVTQARALCDSMKANGITIFTVGFQVPVEVVPTLQYCATSPKHWYPAEDGAMLRKTFKEIANRLNGLRLSS